MRCFVGIPLPDATRAALVAACREVRAVDSHWRGEKWVSAENLHVTLAFLGDIPEESIPLLREAIRNRLASTRAFTLPFAGLSAVPNARRARMLWAAYDDPDGACSDLAAEIGRAAREFGVVPEDRAFKAHVTLVRARRPRQVGTATLSALADAEPAVPTFVSVASATLFSSTLSKAGPQYDTLESWTFPT